MLFSLKVALRFLRESRHQTLFILIGIILGVSVQVYISNMIVALDRNILDSTIGSSSQLTIETKKQFADQKDYINQPHNRKKISDYKEIVSFLNTVEEVKAVSTTVNSTAMYTKGDTSYSLGIKGIDLLKADKIYNLQEKIIEGSFYLNSNNIIIGKKLAEDNNIKIGDLMKLNFPKNKEFSFIVSAIFDLKNEQTNSQLAFIDIATAQKIMNLQGSVNSIEAKLNDPFDLPKAEIKVKEFIKNFDITGWQEQNPSLMTALKGQKASTTIIQLFVIFAVALSVSSVLAVSVIQKSKEIGILKAMGATNFDTSMIFVIQGGALGLIGSFFGYILGISLVKFFFRFINEITKSNYIYIPSKKSFFYTLFFALIIGMISSAVPARKSASLNPIDIIRNS